MKKILFLSVLILLGVGCSNSSKCAVDKYREQLNVRLVATRARLQTTANDLGEKATICETTRDIDATLGTDAEKARANKETVEQARARCINGEIEGLQHTLQKDDAELLAYMKVTARNPADFESKNMRVMLEACDVGYQQ